MLRVAVNGNRVAYSWEDNEAHDDNYAGIDVRHVGRRRDEFGRVYGRPRTDGPAGHPQALDLALCAGGQVAFIGEYGGDEHSATAPIYEVRISRGRHTVLLDRGADIKPGSLRATPGRIAWINADSARHVSTTCARPTRSVAVPRLTVDEVFGE